MSGKQRLVSAGRHTLARLAQRPAAARVLSRAAREMEMASRPPAVARLPVPAAAAAGTRLRLNRLCGPDAWDDPTWLMYDRLLGLSGRVHRKDFEWVHCVYGLEALQALGPSTSVLGVGAGRESPLYYFANRCGVCVATDLYSGHFADWEAKDDFPEHPEKYAPFPFRRDGLVAMRVDGRVLPFDDGAYDVVYSLSSIEHFGGHHAAAQAMREMARVTRPGGILCVATEWIIEGGDHYEYFTPQAFQEFVIDASGFELTEPFDTTPPPRQLVDDPVWLDGDTSRMPHIVLGEGSLRWTSAIVFLRRPGGDRVAA